MSRSVARRREREFIAAVLAGDVTLVELLLGEGCSVEARDPEHGETALLFASQSGTLEVVRALLDAGADVRATDDRGRTALHTARGVAVARMLIAANAAVDSSDADGMTPLMRAVESADAELVRVLMQYGANPALADRGGQSAVDRAELMGMTWLTCILSNEYSGGPSRPA